MAWVGALFLVWLLGTTMTAGALGRMGGCNPTTLGECFSGDHTIDFWLVVLWPIFWPCWFSWKIGRFFAWLLAA